MKRRSFLKACSSMALAGAAASCGGETASKLLRSFLPGNPAGRPHKAVAGMITPLLTPFSEDGAVDLRALEQLVEWNVEQGADAVYIAGYPGEFQELAADEALAMVEAAVRVADGGARVLATGNVQRHARQADDARDMVQSMVDAGVDGCFLVLPKGIPHENGPVADYLIQIHDAVECPLYLHESPADDYRFSREFLAGFMRYSQFVGLKDALSEKDGILSVTDCGLPERLETVRGRISIYQAVTRFMVASLNMGCAGGINVATNVSPGLAAKLYRTWREDDHETARIAERHLVVIDGMLARCYMTSAKLILERRGLSISSRVRRPEAPPCREEWIDELHTYVRRAEAELGISGAPRT